MKRFILYIICALLFSPAMAQQKKKKKATQRPQYVRRTDLLFVHDTMSAPVTLADSIAYEASKHLGKPYKLGTKGPNIFDCSGFTSYVYRQLGFNLGSNSREQYKQGIKVSREHIHKGDMVFFTGRDMRGGVGHVGIVFDVNKENRTFSFIHAATSKGITLQRFPDSGYYTKRLIGFRRMVDVTSPAPLPADNTFYHIVPPPIAIETESGNADKLQETADNDVTTHVVKRGENVASIARKYGFSSSQVRRWNNLKPETGLREGQTLIIKTNDMKPSEAVLASMEKAEKERLGAISNHHITVQEGETVYSLSEKFNCTVRDIANWNNLKSNILEPGQELVIRPVSSEAIKDTIENGELVHTVQKGENLYQIARIYGCQLKELKQWNNLQENVVAPGTRLTIMRADKEGVHTVRAGETLEGICTRYNCNMGQLKEWNNLTSNTIRPGRILKIREDAKSIYDKDTFNHTTQSGLAIPIAMIEEGGIQYENVYYTVQSGDQYGKIARKHKVSVNKLMEWNKVSPTKLRPGMKIIVNKIRIAPLVPASPVANNTQEAAPETEQQNNEAAADNTARETNATTPPARNAQAKTVEPVDKAPQQTLTAEEITANEDGNIYSTVKSGDTFKKIALKYNTTTGRLLEWNNLTEYKLVPGKKMIVGKSRAGAQQQAAVKPQPARPSTPAPQPVLNAEGNIVYTVKDGDNLYKISRKHGCTVAQLKEWNGLTTDRLKLKQKLIIKQ